MRAGPIIAIVGIKVGFLRVGRGLGTCCVRGWVMWGWWDGGTCDSGALREDKDGFKMRRVIEGRDRDYSVCGGEAKEGLREVRRGWG